MSLAVSQDSKSTQKKTIMLTVSAGNKQLETEIKSTILFIIALKKEILVMNLTKYVQDLYAKKL